MDLFQCSVVKKSFFKCFRLLSVMAIKGYSCFFCQFIEIGSPQGAFYGSPWNVWFLRHRIKDVRAMEN